MSQITRFLTGAAIGAGAMYFLDPIQGSKRRGQVRDQARRALRALEEAELSIGKTARDLSNRTHGLMADARGLARNTDPITDDVLVERIRSRMGHVVAQPRTIDVASTGGRVVLRGSVTAPDAQQLLRTIKSMRGVETVENELEVHPGPAFKPSPREGWPPAMRFLAGSAGGALALYGTRKNRLGRFTLGTVGLSLLARALQSHPTR
jgi:BON domain